MINTLVGLVAGTSTLFSTATALQPMNITRIDTNDIEVYVAKTQDIQISGAGEFEIIVDNGDNVTGYDGSDDVIDFTATKGTTLKINAQTGHTAATYKIGNQRITVPANPLVK